MPSEERNLKNSKIILSIKIGCKINKHEIKCEVIPTSNKCYFLIKKHPFLSSYLDQKCLCST